MFVCQSWNCYDGTWNFENLVFRVVSFLWWYKQHEAPSPLNTQHVSCVHLGESYLRGTRALLLRASLMQHDVIQRAPMMQGFRGARGGPGGGPDRHHFASSGGHDRHHMSSDRMFY